MFSFRDAEAFVNRKKGVGRMNAACWMCAVGRTTPRVKGKNGKKGAEEGYSW
jgi:hypothetical protein